MVGEAQIYIFMIKNRDNAKEPPKNEGDCTPDLQHFTPNSLAEIKR